MKVLIDECIPRKFKDGLSGHECRTVPEAGLAGKENGELLAFAESNGFNVFLTMDKGVEYEQDLAGQRIAILILRARSNRLADLYPLVPALLEQIRSIKPGQIVKVGG
jgi:predicted nuclease of predicted toxin-antitoxin system